MPKRLLAPCWGLTFRFRSCIHHDHLSWSGVPNPVTHPARTKRKKRTSERWQPAGSINGTGFHETRMIASESTQRGVWMEEKTNPYTSLTSAWLAGKFAHDPYMAGNKIIDFFSRTTQRGFREIIKKPGHGTRGPMQRGWSRAIDFYENRSSPPQLLFHGTHRPG